MYRIVSALAVSVTCLAGMGAAQADQGAAAYPDKPIKIVIPYSAGGAPTSSCVSCPNAPPGCSASPSPSSTSRAAAP